MLQVGIITVDRGVNAQAKKAAGQAWRCGCSSWQGTASPEPPSMQGDGRMCPCCGDTESLAPTPPSAKGTSPRDRYSQPRVLLRNDEAAQSQMPLMGEEER